MSKGVITTAIVVDLKTGFPYGLRIDAEGNCTGIQPLNAVIEKMDGKVIDRFGPSFTSQFNNISPMLPPNAQNFEPPYGQVMYAIELTQEGKRGGIFTIVWPSKEEYQAGARPVLAKKELPEDLIKAGLAPFPKNAKGQKGAGVDNDEELKEALKNIEGMIGLDRAKHDIKQNIAVARFNRMKQEMGMPTKPISRHMVFTGNPGTGKTTFAREVAKVYHALGFIEKPTVHEVKREDLVAGFIGQTALKTKEQIDKAKGGILFIDEAYALSREGNVSDSKDFGREAIDTLVAAMENMREDLIVIVAGYPEPMKKFIDANEGLKSRFMTYIGFDDYTLPQLGEILDTMLVERGYTMHPAAREHTMKLLEEERSRTKKDFGNGRTVRNLVEKAEKELALRLETEGKLSRNHGLSVEDIKAALTTITLADVKAISLHGLGAKKDDTPVIGFGSRPAAHRLPANDEPPAAAPVSPKTHFPKVN